MTEYAYKMDDGRLVHAPGGRLIVDEYPDRMMAFMEYRKWTTVVAPEIEDRRCSMVEWLSNDGKQTIPHKWAVQIGHCPEGGYFTEGAQHGEHCTLNDKTVESYGVKASDLTAGEKL